jgi:iron(III) transport system substrate-binding protein
MNQVFRAALLLVSAASLALLLSACDGKHESNSEQNPEPLVVYTAHDRQFSEPILQAFTEKTGIRVSAVYDTESTKTVGLVNRIRSEAQRPRCDVFWNNEIINTLNLKAEGLLQPCQPEAAENYPAQFRDREGVWFGFAARARVLIVNNELVKTPPTSVQDLSDEQWRGKIGIAKPLFGTTASHVACLFALIGPEAAREQLLSFKQNEIQVLGGNRDCARMVAAGALAFALTDTDDAMAEIEAGSDVSIVFPDSHSGGVGTLLLPNTLAMVRGCEQPEAAVKLIDFLLSREIEERLSDGPAAQIPLQAGLKPPARLEGLEQVVPMKVDFEQAGAMFPVAAEFIEDEFLE